jgi:polysaccharide pyruvyl transferase WcaK-like protein
VLVEPNAHHLLNLGDVAMLVGAVRRLRRLWPDAWLGVITDSPERLALHCPGAVPVPAEGRAQWFRERYTSEKLHTALPAAWSELLRRGEDGLRVSRPGIAERVIRATSRLRREDCAPMTRFLEALRGADVLVVTGAGALTDDFAPLATTVLDLLDAAHRAGAVTAYLGQGLGPATDPRLLRRARSVLQKVDLISLRERRAGSALLRELGVPMDRVVVTGDDAIEMALRSDTEAPLGAGLGVNVRSARYSGVGNDVVDRLRPVLAAAADRYGADLVACPISRVANEADGTAIARITGLPAEDIRTPEEAIDRIRRCRVVVTGSYHAAVFALAQGVSAVALAASPYYVGKFAGLREQFEGRLDVVRLDDEAFPAALQHAIDGAWSAADEAAPGLRAAAASQARSGEAAYARLGALLTARTARGFNIQLQNHPAWDERAETAAVMLARHLGRPDRPVRIADLGCGNERLRGALEEHLVAPHDYQGYDLLPQRPTVIALDVERELPAADHDVVFCLGLLEYFADLPHLLRRLRSRYDTAVLSYSVFDAPSPLTRRQRRARGWRTHLTAAEVTAGLEQAGWTILEHARVARGRTGLWLVGAESST